MYNQIEWLTADQVAEQLHCAKFTIQRDMREGVLKASKPGRSWITKQEWVEAYVESKLNTQAVDGSKESKPLTWDDITG